MNDTSAQPSVLIISDDNALVDALISNKKGEQVFHARDSVQLILDDPTLLDGNSIVIFDVGTNENTLDSAIDQTIKIKQADPTQVLVLVGEQELLADVLKSSIQPLVFRAFPKPVSPNQIALAFKSGNAVHADLAAREAAGEDITQVGPAENKTNVAALANSRSNNSAIFAALGVLALAVVGWLIFGGGDDDATQPIAEQEIVADASLDEPVVTVSATVQRINQLNQEATAAMAENRMISPPGDNALEYFDQVLSLDAYDTTAYEGKKEIASRLRTSYDELVAGAEFDRALQAIEVLQRIDPLNLSNDQLRVNLQESIDSHVKEIQSSGTSEQIAQTAAVLERLEAKFEGSKSASDALKAEQDMMKKIDVALNGDVLIPPTKNNAYALVSEALKSNSVSKANITPRVKSLSAKLLNLAQGSLEKDNFEEFDKLAALVKRLNVNPKSLASLNTKAAARKAELKAEEEARIAAEGGDAEQGGDGSTEDAAVPEPELPKIIPAKIVKREPPRYPNRALNKGIAGWVEVAFRINNKGEPFNIVVASAEPEGMFESAATRAVRKWRFTPARNETTGLAVESEVLSTKLQFRLD